MGRIAKAGRLRAGGGRWPCPPPLSLSPPPLPLSRRRHRRRRVNPIERQQRRGGEQSRAPPTDLFAHPTNRVRRPVHPTPGTQARTDALRVFCAAADGPTHRLTRRRRGGRSSPSSRRPARCTRALFLTRPSENPRWNVAIRAHRAINWASLGVTDPSPVWWSGGAVDGRPGGGARPVFFFWKGGEEVRR